MPYSNTWVSLSGRLNYCAMSTTAGLCMISVALQYLVHLPVPSKAVILMVSHATLFSLANRLTVTLFAIDRRYFLGGPWKMLGGLYILGGPRHTLECLEVRLLTIWERLLIKIKAHNSHPLAGGGKAFNSAYIAFTSS